MATSDVPAMSIDELEELFDHIEALPQELEDEFLEHWIDLTPKGIITIDKEYEPPPQLHIDRKSRATAMRIYFSTTQIFHVVMQGADVLSPWVESLSGFTQAAIREIRVDFDAPSHAARAAAWLTRWQGRVGAVRHGALRLQVPSYCWQKSAWSVGWWDLQGTNILALQEQLRGYSRWPWDPQSEE